MSKNIFVEGLKNDIVPIVCTFLEKCGYNICDRARGDEREGYSQYESPFYGAELSIVDEVIALQPDLTIICNALGYSRVIGHYSQRTDIPLLVLTGGGPDLVEEIEQYTPHVLTLPPPPEKTLENYLIEKVRQIIG